MSQGRVAAQVFERKYEESPDPWGYCSSAYERSKYLDTLAALPPGRFARALEVGCSIGVFSQMLAPRCDQLVALDFAPRAIELARERLGEQPNVELLQASFPEQAPAGQWELIVCSEVLYYLGRELLAEAIAWLGAQLRGGAVVLAVSWRGSGASEPLHGDQAHDMLAAQLSPWHDHDGRTQGYRLDRFDGRAR